MRQYKKENRKYPSKLKVSKVTPVFKDDDDTDPNNYRAISLLSIFNQIFEKLMYKHLVNFIEKHNLIDKRNMVSVRAFPLIMQSWILIAQSKVTWIKNVLPARHLLI